MPPGLMGPISEWDFIILGLVAAASIVVRLGAGEEGHLICDDLDAVALDILVVGPAGVVNAATDHDLHAFVDILLDRLADPVEAGDPVPFGIQIGRASCRDRVCQYV